MSLRKSDYRDVSDVGVDDAKREQLYEAQTECCVLWTNRDGWPIGVMHRFVWPGRWFWVTCTAERNVSRPCGRGPRARWSCRARARGSAGTSRPRPRRWPPSTTTRRRRPGSTRPWPHRQRRGDDEAARPPGPSSSRRLDTPTASGHRARLRSAWITYDGNRLEAALRGVDYDRPGQADPEPDVPAGRRRDDDVLMRGARPEGGATHDRLLRAARSARRPGGAMRALVLGGSVFVGKRLVRRCWPAGTRSRCSTGARRPPCCRTASSTSSADRTDIGLDAAGARLTSDWDVVYDVSGFVMAAGGSDIGGAARPARRAGRRLRVRAARSWPTTSRWPGSSRGRRTCRRTRRAPATYGGFKAVAEQAMLERHAATGFPASVVRPAAIYGPDNNIYDMETPMFLRLLQSRPILVPHGGLVATLLRPRRRPVRADGRDGRPAGGPGRDLQRHRRGPDVAALRAATLADDRRGRAGRRARPRRRAADHRPDRCSVTCSASGTTPSPASTRPSGCSASGRATTSRAVTSRRTSGSGRRGGASATEPLRDPVWGASWDFDAEAELAARLR